MTGLREQRKLATRTALGDAALELAAERGVAGVTVEAIADRAGVSVRTFFNYFSAKEEAVMASHREEVARLVAEIRLRPPDEPILDSLEASAIAFAAPGGSRLAQTRRLVGRIEDSPELLPQRMTAFAEVERDLARVIGDRLALDPDVDPYPSTVAATVVAVTTIALRRSRDGRSGPGLEERIRIAFAQLRAGLSQPVQVAGRV